MSSDVAGVRQVQVLGLRGKDEGGPQRARRHRGLWLRVGLLSLSPRYSLSLVTFVDLLK